MSDERAKATKSSTPKIGDKIADTADVTCRNGFDDVTLPLEHGRLLLGDDVEVPENGENIRLRQGKRWAFWSIHDILITITEIASYRVLDILLQICFRL